ncbi:inner nuclear membrane protein enriched at telomere/subtelomere region [Mortierella alpina]|nr:inner nuclear membrane protein enriched at telomere/subtelomere region [Mortierella alpina]
MPPIKVPRYLQPDFDPLKIKMDTIREILISHNIRAPTGAVKKQELIDLFEQHIRPQASALRKYYETIIPSEEGIIKVPRSSTTTLAFGHSDSEATSSQASTGKTVSAASKQRSAERNHRSSDLAPPQTSHSNAVGKQTERNIKPSAKPATSIKSPRTNDSIEDTDLEEKKRAQAENFSNENPFQSGGESNRRRRRSKSRESASSGSSRNNSRSRSSHRKPTVQSRDRSWDQENSAHFDGSNQPFVLKKFKSTPKCPASLLEIEKRPYPSSPLLAKNQQALSWLYPTCIPCPTRATCQSPHSEPLCPPDYSLRPHVLSFGGLLPLSPFCGLDNLDEYQSLQVADAAEKIVHINAGSQECKMYSRPPMFPGLLAGQRMSLEELKSDIVSMKHSSVSNKDFDEYWDLALEKLHGRTDSLAFERVGGTVYVRSLNPSKSLKCQLRHAIVGWLIKFWPHILGTLSTFLVGWLVLCDISRRRRESTIVNSMVGKVLERLQEQARLNDGNIFLSIADLFVFEMDLRDALLEDVEPCQHERLWAKVATAVGSHPSVREGMQELQGDVYRVWEWRATSNSSSSKSPYSGSTLSSGTRNSSGSKEPSARTGHASHSREQDLVAYPRLEGQGKAT